jgi:hypothetical protein
MHFQIAFVCARNFAVIKLLRGVVKVNIGKCMHVLILKILKNLVESFSHAQKAL